MTPSSERAFALELQLLNSSPDTRRTGSIYNIEDVSTSLVQDNEWFDLRIAVRRKTITVNINGTKANEWKQPAGWQPGGKVPNARLGGGGIGFQSLSGEAWFKDIRIVLP